MKKTPLILGWVLVLLLVMCVSFSNGVFAQNTEEDNETDVYLNELSKKAPVFVEIAKDYFHAMSCGEKTISEYSAATVKNFTDIDPVLAYLGTLYHINRMFYDLAIEEIKTNCEDYRFLGGNDSEAFIDKLNAIYKK